MTNNCRYVDIIFKLIINKIYSKRSTALCSCVYLSIFHVSQTCHLTTGRMICPPRVCSRATRRRWTPCRSTTGCCTHAQETGLSEPSTWWWVSVKKLFGRQGFCWTQNRANSYFSVNATRKQTCVFCRVCCRVINVLVCLRVTAPKWAACWCPRLPACIIAFILVPVTRPSAATASR